MGETRQEIDLTTADSIMLIITVQIDITIWIVGIMRALIDLIEILKE